MFSHFISFSAVKKLNSLAAVVYPEVFNLL